MAPANGNAARIAEAKKLSKTDATQSESIYQEILSKDPGNSDAALRDYETALMGLGELYRDNKSVVMPAILSSGC
jgi:26S proteasome regulatory subunit N6